MIVDDAADQTVTAAAFNLVRYIAHLRIDAGRLAVIDATNVKPAARARMTRLAKRKLVPIFAIVLDFDADVCLNRNMRRRDRRVPDSVILNQIRELRDSLPSLLSEGFEDIVILSTPDELGRLRLVRSSSGK
jgi:protein phosphatase